MTVKELIEKLEALDPNAKVLIGGEPAFDVQEPVESEVGGMVWL